MNIFFALVCSSTSLIYGLAQVLWRDLTKVSCVLIPRPTCPGRGLNLRPSAPQALYQRATAYIFATVYLYSTLIK
jgi:hypothetical protein